MNNAIGLNLPTRSVVESVPSVPVGNINTSQSCNDGECLKQGDDGFLAVLNAELQSLSEPEAIDLSSMVGIENIEAIENVEEIDDLSLEGNELLPIQQAGDDGELIAGLISEIPPEVDDDSLKLLDTEIKMALSDLPKDLADFPLTDENKLVILQHIVQTIEQNNPELMSQLKKQSGQDLPLTGSLLPNVEKAITSQVKMKQEQVNSIDTSLNGQTTDLLKNQVGNKSTENGLDLSDLTPDESDSDIDSAMKAAFDKGEEKLNLKDKDNKKGFEAMLAKGQAQAEVAPQPQKFTTETVSTPINNVLGANQASINTPTATAVQTGTTLLLPQNPSPEQWGSALGDKVQMMINTKLDSAEVRIDPPHLGKMDISIKMTDDGAHVMIHTQHAATRELVDAASYRLKEMLQDAGQQNVNVDVSHRENQQSGGQMADNNDSQGLINTNTETVANNEKATTEDVIARTYQTGRPSLDIFA